jgi:AcrR family transcriptional regulator
MQVVPLERLTPERRRQLTRDALVSAAAEVFAEKGFHAASLDEIAEAAGFTRGAIYSNFANKEELLFAVLNQFQETLLAGVSEAMEGEATDGLVPQAEAAAAAWARWLRRSRVVTALALELRLYALRNPETRQRLADAERAQVQTMARFIEDVCTQRGLRLTLPANDIAAICLAAVEGLEQKAAIDDQHGPDYEALVNALFTLIAQAGVEPAR